MTAKTMAVLDLGKTNLKFFIVNSAGEVLHRERSDPFWTTRDGLRVLDDAALESWLRDCLASTARAFDVGGLVTSGHGCTVALAGADDLVTPVLDYEQELPPEVAARVDTLLPGYAETLTPWLPEGMSYGRHLLWLRDRDPGLLDRTEHILTYPQFWGWRLGGRACGEKSYLGCHGHLWNPSRQDYSSLVDRMGWRGKMPPILPVGVPIGEMTVEGRGIDVPPGIVLHNGVHDSNAALTLHKAGMKTGFTLISSGTWVIVMNPNCPVSAMVAERDMVGNVDVEGNLVPTIRFMGGREYDVISRGWRDPIPPAVLEKVVASGVMALPSFAAAGPFQGRRGELTDDRIDGADRAAVAVLYVAMMTDLALDLIHSMGTMVLDGGMARTDGFAAALAQLRPGQPLLVSSETEGSAKGAALLAFRALGEEFAPAPLFALQPVGLPGLEAYRDAWRGRVAGML